MKVRVVLSIDIDPELHNATYGRGTRAKDVADDVRSHVLNMVQRSPLADECGATVELSR